MFSSSNSYLGGGNSGRPGPPQYGQQPPYGAQPQQQQQPQQNGFAPQPTGYGAGGLQPQYTGYPAAGQQQQSVPPVPQLQTQYTGFPAQSQPQQFQSQPPMPPLPQQYQQTGVQQPQQPQPTGQTSSQMAQSFQTASTGQAADSKSSKKGAKIPNIRLSFITAQDQAKFETLFKSAVGDGQALSGDKSRDLLLRSKLPGDVLSQIWTLSDTTKSGQLLFPEFALAMYLCNLKLVGKTLPSALPERILNEVSSMVDIISFNVADAAPPPTVQSNAPSFDTPLRQNTLSPPAPQQPQPQQPSNAQLLNQLSVQPTGFQPQQTGFQPQPTGFQPQQTGFQPQQSFQPQPTGFQPQPSGLQTQQTGLQPQATGFSSVLSGQPSAYTGPRPPMPPMPTGFGQGLSPGVTGIAPLNSQPTGIPGQWGLVNAPASGLPNIEALHQRMMPQPGREGGFTTAGLSGNATVPWAVTKDEKKIYDQLFKAWDGFNKGFIGGDVAIEVFGQSGLEKQDLEKLWNLADAGNKGKLNMDEFAVAMHLIYRKLNGYPLPNRLPPELVPPSTRNFSESIGTVKSLLSQDAESRKSSGVFSNQSGGGVSYLKNHSFRGSPSNSSFGRKDATVFKNNDDDVGYRSSARRRLGAGGRSPSPAQPSSPSSERSSEELTTEQLQKKIREKQVLLDAIDFKDESAADEDDVLDRRDRRDAEDLYRRIRRIQEDIDAHPDASLRGVDTGAERRTLKRQLQSVTDKLPELASRVRRTERSIADAKLELFRLKDAKAHPNSAASIVGTGPGGSITESDRLKARAKAMMQQRSAALAGKPIPPGDDDALAAPKRLEAETSRIKNERETTERMIQDMEDSVRDFGRGLEDSLKEGGDDSSKEHEKRRWEDGLGVEDEVKDFIFDLQRSSRSAKIRREENGPSRSRDPAPSSIYDRSESSPASSAAPAASSRPAAIPTSSASSTYSSYKTAEERAAFIKQQAEQRMAERLAQLGIKPAGKTGESAAQRHERENKERNDKLRLAEEEDAKRERERQRRIAEEANGSPPTPKQSTKKPPPPPSRKAAKSDADETRKKAEEEARAAQENALRIEQQAQETARRDMEDETSRQEAELAREQEAAQARLKALEESMKQGKVRKEEEKRRKQAAQKDAKEKEARLAAQRAEIEAMRERERQLQLQMERLAEEDSSDDDDDGPQQITPHDTTPSTSQELSREAISPPVVSPPPPPPMPQESSHPASPPAAPPLPATSSSTDTTKNPFLKMVKSQEEASAPAPVTSPPSTGMSTNPFIRDTKSMTSSEPMAQPDTSSIIPSRSRREEEEWSVVGSDDSSDDEDDVGRSGPNTRQLASMLFGTMAPPRPLSAMDDPKPDSRPTNESIEGSAPPPPPPMPGSGAPAAPPPPPPPMPSSGGPPPPPPMPTGPPAAGGPPKTALLGEIQTGTRLKKVQTKDRSQSSVAGRVL